MKNFTPPFRFIGALILSALIVALAIKIVIVFIPGISTAIAAIAGATGTILAAIINNYFTRTNQIESEERVKKAQIEAEIRKEKQQNYNSLLMSIGEYIRKPDAKNDDFHSIHIRSWIYGNEDIIKKTNEFIEINRDSNMTMLNVKLEELLRLIRKDTGLVDIDPNIKIGNPFKKQEIRGT